MFFKDYFNEVVSYLKNHKLKNFLIINFFVLIFLVCNILIQVSTNFTQIFEDYTKNYSESRTLVVYKKMNYVDIINDLKNREHIDVAYNQNYNIATGELEISNEKININIKPLSQEYSPKIISGRIAKNNNEIICPKYLAINDNEIKKISDLVKIENYINDNLKLNYNKEIFVDLYQIDIYEKYSRNVKIVGLYDDGYSMGMFSDCYMPEDNVKIIAEEQKTIYSDKYLSQVKVQDDSLASFVVVDELKNVDIVSKKLVDDGYIVEKQLTMKTDLLDNVNKISRILFIVMFLFTTIIFIIYLSNMVKSQKKEIGLYKMFGFTNKEVTNIVIFEMLTIFVISAVIEFIIIILLLNKGNFEIDKILDYAYIDLKLFFVPQSIFYISLLLIGLIISKIAMNKVFHLDVGRILNENNL